MKQICRCGFFTFVLTFVESLIKAGHYWALACSHSVFTIDALGASHGRVTSINGSSLRDPCRTLETPPGGGSAYT